MNTDSFYLGEDCYVYVNYAITRSSSYIREDKDSLVQITYAAWVGEYITPFLISFLNIEFEGNPDHVWGFEMVKDALGKKLQVQKEKLIEIIKNGMERD